MIKSLFEETEEQAQTENTQTPQPETLPFENALPETFSAKDDESINLIEMQSSAEPDIDQINNQIFNNDERDLTIEQDIDDISPSADRDPPKINFTLSHPFETVDQTAKKAEEFELFQMQSKPESTDETARKSGLAMSAAIVLFGSVVFMLIIGWFADLLLGTSPWGIIAGIVLGSVIGFFQFFRTTSQILKNKD